MIKGKRLLDYTPKKNEKNEKNDEIILKYFQELVTKNLFYELIVKK